MLATKYIWLNGKYALATLFIEIVMENDASVQWLNGPTIRPNLIATPIAQRSERTQLFRVNATQFGTQHPRNCLRARRKRQRTGVLIEATFQRPTQPDQREGWNRMRNTSGFSTNCVQMNGDRIEVQVPMQRFSKQVRNCQQFGSGCGVGQSFTQCVKCLPMKYLVILFINFNALDLYSLFGFLISQLGGHAQGITY